MIKKYLLLLGYYDPESPRTWTLKHQYESEGWQITECRTERSGFFRKCADSIKCYRKHRAQIDAVLVMFPGEYLMPLLWLLTRFPRKTLILDALVTQYDMLVNDRKMIAWWNPLAWALWCVDILTCHLADEVLMDTEENKKYLARAMHLKPTRITTRYLDARTDLFHPDPHSQKLKDGHLHVFFYGSYIPLQGIEHILDAAKILEHKAPNVRITLLGGGQTYGEMRMRAAQLKLEHVSFHKSVPIGALPALIREADLCLGIFGTGAKTKRVIPHKVYDAIACGTPVLTADTPAIRERFANDPRVVRCQAGSPEDIAQKITAFAHKNI